MSICLTIGLLVWVWPPMAVNAIDMKKNYYLYEAGQLPFTKCLRHDGLGSRAPLTLSSVAKGCKVFHFRSDGAIQATASTTDPKPSEWCLDAASGLGNDGDVIQLLECNGKISQVWHLTEGQLKGINGKCIIQGTADRAILGSCQHGITWRTEVWERD